MKRIFLTLAVVSTAILAGTFVLGWTIGDAASRDPDVQRRVAWHFLTAVAGLMFAALLHAIVLTYFMGTGRWIEETSQAYRLGEEPMQRSKALKYSTLPWMAGALLLLILTGGFGAVADPASPAGADGFGGISSATLHFLIAALTLAANLFVNVLEYNAIHQNSQLIEDVLANVLRIRKDKGLPTE